ncbi:hypothetical protein H6F55_00415 [Phormidium sp. FACHB-322]|nr:hypothetical protein [Phormidium sp. FACHB-77]MBD2028457.1 hypothetical protein [Phormidium sp. FACHB-322]MBD2053613.1 hypothetical protein [Leptolyngbya sp. FACHB-60]
MILGWLLGGHCAETFAPLWSIVADWNCYFYVADGWSLGCSYRLWRMAC